MKLRGSFSLLSCRLAVLWVECSASFNTILTVPNSVKSSFTTILTVPNSFLPDYQEKTPRPWSIGGVGYDRRILMKSELRAIGFLVTETT